MAHFVDEAPVLDGILDDAAWQAAVPLDHFVQRDPQQGEPSSEPTQVRVVYIAEAIYFGFLCRDSNPDRIVATERRRDQDLSKDDSVAILLDTFLDRRNKLSDALSVDLNYALDEVDMPWGDFSSHVVNTRINYAFSNRPLASTGRAHAVCP